MPGTSPRLLSEGASYLRAHRIHQASIAYHGGDVRRPSYPDLNPGVWGLVGNHFEKTIQATRARLALPAGVFTKRQTYVATALLWLWDIQGEHAQFTYTMVEDLIPHIQVNGQHLVGEVSRHTIATVLRMFEDTGAAKYIRGFPGVKSQLVLVSLAYLVPSASPVRRGPALGTQECIVYWPDLPSGVPSVARTPRPVPRPALGTQECSFGYEHLLEKAYAEAGKGKGRARVTRTFNQELVKAGLQGHIDYEAHPKFKFMLRTWRVTCSPEDDWRIQVAVYATTKRLAGKV